MAVTDKQKANLKPAKKGEVRNPNGRPPKLPDLDALGAKLLSEEKNGLTLMEAIIRAMAVKATKGDVRAAEALLDRFYGKPKQPVDMNIAKLGLDAIEEEYTD
jgi:hypothetical protein